GGGVAGARLDGVAQVGHRRLEVCALGRGARRLRPGALDQLFALLELGSDRLDGRAFLRELLLEPLGALLRGVALRAGAAGLAPAPRRPHARPPAAPRAPTAAPRAGRRRPERAPGNGGARRAADVPSRRRPWAPIARAPGPAPPRRARPGPAA